MRESLLSFHEQVLQIAQSIDPKIREFIFEYNSNHNSNEQLNLLNINVFYNDKINNEKEPNLTQQLLFDFENKSLKTKQCFNIN